MNYSLITPDILEKRLGSLPAHIQELATSEQVEKLVMQIGRSHYLSRDKVQTLQQMVGLVLLGVMNLRDLKGELSEKLFLNYAHTVALTHELDEELFNPIRTDLEQIYTPLEEEVAAREVAAPEEPIEQEIEPLTEEAPIISEETEAPVIIHKEISVNAQDPNRATKFADLSKSFSFFRKEEAGAPAAARVETAETKPAENGTIFEKLKKEEKKVVNYNELKTPVAEPFGSSDFINLEAFDAPRQNENFQTPDGGAVLQGNHIDLRPKNA